MADKTIIAKFISDGLAQLGTEVEATAGKMDLLAKAQSIVNQSTDNLTKKQSELREQISSTGGIVQKMNETGRTSSTLYTELTSNLQKLVVEYQNETKALQDKSTELKKVTLDSSNYAKILTQVANGEVSSREAAKLLKQEFISLKLQGKQNTEQFQQLKQVAGELNDTISDTSAEIKQAGSDTSGLDHVLRVSNSVLAGFGLVQGAVGLFGVENENLQKTLLRVNAAMLILNSAQQIQEELTKEDSKLKVIQAGAQKLYSVAVGESTGALLVFRQVLFGLGIGAVIAGLYLLVTNWERVKDAVTGTTEAMRENARIAKLNADTRRDAADSIKGEVANIYELVAVAKNENLTRADRQRAIDELQKKYPDYLKNISLETIGTDATSKAIQAQIELLTQREQIKKLADKRAELSNKLIDNEAIDEQFTAYEKVKKFLAEALSGKNEDGSRDDAGNPDLQKVLTTARSRVKTEIQKQVDDIDALFSQVLGKIGKSNKSVFSEEVIKKATKDSETILQQLKKKLEELNKQIEQQISSDVLKGKDVSKDSFLQTLKKQADELLGKINMIELAIERFKNPIVKLDIESIKPINTSLKVEPSEKDKEESNKKIGEYLEGLKKTVKNTINVQDATGIGNNALNFFGIPPLQEFSTAVEARVAVAQGIYTQLANLANQTASLVSGFTKIQTDKELTALEDKRKNGIITEKQYQKESAKIKNEAAKKEKAAAVTMAFLQVPMAVLSAFTGTQGGIIVKGIAAGLAGAFALAQAALVAAAPAPKFFKGVLGLKLGNNPKGRDTIPSMLNEGESVMTTDETNKYYGALKAMRENKFHQLYIPVGRMLKPDLPAAINVGAHVRKLKNIDTDVQVMQLLKVEISGMKEEISFVGEYIKKGNTDRVRGNNKLISTIDKNRTDGY